MSILNIGNDVVCLVNAPNKTNDSRFKKRVFTDSEQHLIDSVLSSHFLLWAIWAIKEATFKAYQQEQNHASFSPKTIEVNFDKDGFFEDLFISENVERSRLQGHSRLGEAVYRFELFLEDDCIHSVVVKNPADFADVSYQIRKVEGLECYEAQSIEAKKLALSFAKRQGVKADEIRREQKEDKRKSPPKFYHLGEQLTIPLSLSHDGPFVAVCLYNNQSV